MSQRQPQHLFDSSPPRELNLVRDLFYDRKGELQFGLDLLRATPSFDKIFAVHGMTRCGKSHLVMRLLADVEAESLPYLVFKVNANNRGSARAVLEECFFELWNSIRGLDVTQVPEGMRPTHELALTYLEECEPLVDEEASEIALGRTRQKAEELRGEIKLAPPTVGITGSGKLEVKEGQEERWTRRPPSERNLIELLNYEAHLLSQLHGDKKVLLFIDDLDLLDQPETPGQEEANQLVQWLKALAERPHVVVLTTIRHSYFNGREKDFKDFIVVRPFEVSALKAIYQKHIELFNEGQEIFSRPALRWLVNSASGRVGMFLHRCYQVWREYSLASPGKRIGERELKRYVQRDVEENRREPSLWPLLAKIEEAVAAGQMQLALEEDIRSTGLIFTVLDPVPGQVGKYNIDTLYADVIKQMQQVEG